jgi:hypothetical protein
MAVNAGTPVDFERGNVGGCRRVYPATMAADKFQLLQTAAGGILSDIL